MRPESLICFLLNELIIDRDDCSKQLLEWGMHVAKNNSRPLRVVQAARFHPMVQTGTNIPFRRLDADSL